ncbi:hypothetical protein HW10_31210 [Pseudomonas aeruginosa]|nr:hypothetical protein HW10_31210 [Pseudomonas aeruginosa]KRV03567.1 hypothetical protein AN455_29505 [Pseudomonas aeruginosa]KRV11620.1 hypothetical protein AN456_29420 [Pseudomonas aeruginosa]
MNEASALLDIRLHLAFDPVNYLFNINSKTGYVWLKNKSIYQGAMLSLALLASNGKSLIFFFSLTSLNTLSKRVMTSPGVLHMSLIFRKIKDSEISRGGFELSDSMKYFGCMVVINMAGRTVLGPSPLIFTQERTSE